MSGGSSGGGAGTQRFLRVEALLDAALDLPPPQRGEFLERECDDAELRAEVLGLLDAVTASEGFLEAPALGEDHSGRELGPWRLERRLGRGGMGEVWLAQRADGRFEQQVAVKLLRYHDGDDVQRLLREQRLLARLQHPNIARLIDAGSLPDGAPYMVMECVRGTTLMQYAQGRPVEAKLGLFLQVCDAVAFAHRHLIVHRDLKPENILVRENGQAVLLDFGIARLLDGHTGTTRELRLTPQYAAPEQLAGEEQNTQTDVYALGLLLHELLTGKSPWGTLIGSGPIALLQRARAGPPPSPASQADTAALARRLRGDLDAIVHKALRPEMAARYASVEALAQDIRRHLAHAPVHARGDAFGYRLRRLLRRYWLAAGLTLLAFAAMAAALTAISLARNEAVRERDIAQTEARRSKAVRDYLAHMFRDAGQHAGQGDSLTAKQVLDQAAARVQASFSDAPATNAEVLKALGELHFHINDYAGAEPLLQRWLTHEVQIQDPVAAADVRFTLAETLHRMGQREEAARLLAEAQEFWNTDPQRHADVLLTSRMLQARLQREAGDVEAALATLEAALPLRLRQSGREHFETAALYTNLGAAYMQAGRIDDGIAASEQALELWRALNLGAGNDALNTLNNLAAAQFRKGELAQAEVAFAEALGLRRQLHGPSAATAALIGNYARVLNGLERFEEALAHAEEARDMALTHAGEASLLSQAQRVTGAEALLGLERGAQALEVLQGFGSTGDAPPPASLLLRAALVRAEAHLVAGERAAAAQALTDADALLDTGGSERAAAQARLESLHRRLHPL